MCLFLSSVSSTHESQAFDWEVSKQACGCPGKHQAFQSLQSQRGHPNMATGAIGACFSPAKAMPASAAAPSEQAVSPMENIAHDYSDREQLMNT